jgi:hypothetical protein
MMITAFRMRLVLRRRGDEQMRPVSRPVAKQRLLSKHSVDRDETDVDDCNSR